LRTPRGELDESLQPGPSSIDRDAIDELVEAAIQLHFLLAHKK
jgi:hypothetical protein